MKSIPDIENYLNSKVNVKRSPYDNLDLYKQWLLKEKDISILDKNFGNQEYLDAYVKHMHDIGYNQPVILPKPIPMDDLELQIKNVIDTFGSVEDILYEAARLEGRECVAHRTLRGWPMFIGTAIFGKDYDPIKIKYNNFKYGSGKMQILRWAALYYIYIRGEFIDDK